MPRKPDHPSGAKIGLGIRLPPAHMAALKRYARAVTKGNLSAAIKKLIEHRGLVEPETPQPREVIETE